MRLIDADALTEIIKKQICGGCDNRCESGMYCGELALMKLIEAEPTVDAVSVVRCKDCKYYGEEGGSVMDGRYKRCSIFGVWHTGSWYCASGERKSNEID